MLPDLANSLALWETLTRTYLFRALQKLLHQNPQANVHLAHHKVVRVAFEDFYQALLEIYGKVKKS